VRIPLVDATIGTSTGISTGNSATSSCSVISPSHSYTPLNNKASKWRQLAVRYPPGILIHLPSDSPKPLLPVQFSFPQPSSIKDLQDQRRAAVRAVFMRTWSSYKKYSWLKDELSPTSGGFNNRFGGWGATLIDSLDTLWILDMKEEFNEAVGAALTVDFFDAKKLLTVPLVSLKQPSDSLEVCCLHTIFLATRINDCWTKPSNLATCFTRLFDTPSRTPVMLGSLQKHLMELSGPPLTKITYLRTLHP
jgi:glycosyl hydrolase family 47